MSRGYDCIKDLKKDLDVWKIGFRVLDSWIVTASNGNRHMELIIGDSKVREIMLDLLSGYFFKIYFCWLVLYILIYVRPLLLFMYLG